MDSDRVREMASGWVGWLASIGPIGSLMTGLSGWVMAGLASCLLDY